MNKIKLFFFAMVIIVIVSTSFNGMAMTAQVVWINKSKGRVHINGGVNNGVILGATVCFFVSSASFGNELVCGSVVSAEASKAVVKVQKSRAKKMKKGTEAMLLVKKQAKEEVEDIDMVAQVSEINKSEGIIHINGGTDDGFILGATVCFSISPDKELICGTVQEAEGSKAVVKVTKKEAGKMKIGIQAMLKVEEKPKEETKKRGLVSISEN
jgi:ribosomal protein L35AE/L33A